MPPTLAFLTSRQVAPDAVRPNQPLTWLVRRSTLEDVFLTLTGRTLED